MSDDGRVRISGLQRRLERGIANPLLRWILRTPLHRVASRWICLLSYEGRRSGRRYTIPLAYAHHEGDILVVTPGSESDWWRNFDRPRRCSVWLAGVEREAIGRVTDDPGVLDAYLDHHGTLWRGYPSDALQEELVVVRFELA